MAAVGAADVERLRSRCAPVPVRLPLRKNASGRGSTSTAVNPASHTVFWTALPILAAAGALVAEERSTPDSVVYRLGDRCFRARRTQLQHV
jgi:hypothetical protein